MKKFKAIILSAVILAVGTTFLTGCGCSNEEANGISDKPATDVVGEWGERSDDVTVEFNDDGTCIIGGVQGTYEIDEDNTLTVTPNGENGQDTTPLVFEYYNTDDEVISVPANQWSVTDDTLYINGYQYNKDSSTSSNTDTTDDNNVNSSSEISDANSGSTSSSSSNSSGNSSNNTSSTASDSSSNNSSSSASSSTPNSSSSSSSGSSSTTSSTVDYEEGEEDPIINFYTNIDDF